MNSGGLSNQYQKYFYQRGVDIKSVGDGKLEVTIIRHGREETKVYDPLQYSHVGLFEEFERLGRLSEAVPNQATTLR